MLSLLLFDTLADAGVLQVREIADLTVADGAEIVRSELCSWVRDQLRFNADSLKRDLLPLHPKAVPGFETVFWSTRRSALACTLPPP